jgi:hypothetical protein
MVDRSGWARVIAAVLPLLLLAGCAGQALTPRRSTLVEVMPRFQLTCSSRGLRPGTDAFEGCVQEQVADWQGTSTAQDTGRPSAGPNAGDKARKPADCELSPLGGYYCKPRPSS